MPASPGAAASSRRIAAGNSSSRGAWSSPFIVTLRGAAANGAGHWPVVAHAPARRRVGALGEIPRPCQGVSMTGIDFDVGVPASMAVADSGTSGFVSG